MTPAECREAVRTMFADLYPICKVIYSYPNAVRPPLPYIVLDFESIDTVGAFETIEDGILQQQKCKRIPFSAELVAESKTTHAAGVKKVGARQLRLMTSTKLCSFSTASMRATRCVP